MDCINLTSINIPSSIIHIGLDVFRNCSKLSLLDFPYKYYPFQISISDSSLLKRFGIICERITMSECDLSLIEELYEDKNDTPHFYTWLDNNYEASELWAYIGGEDLLNKMEKIRNTFEAELREDVEHELLMYEGWEEIEMEV
jgi:hypothetical protein